MRKECGGGGANMPGQGRREARAAEPQVRAAAYAGFRVPPCRKCGGVLKPDVVFFGDNLPAWRADATREAAAGADALLVVGSSLMARARQPPLARSAGPPAYGFPPAGFHLRVSTCGFQRNNNNKQYNCIVII